MSTYSTLADLLPFAVSLLIAGGVAGFLAGVFGIGGGAILVPVFYQMLGILGVDEAVRMHVAVGTSLAIIVPTSLRSFMGHYAKGVVDMELLRHFMVVVPLGVITASVVAAFISSGMLRTIFAVAALLISAKLLFGRDNWKLGDDIPKGPASYFSGWLIGFLSTFMGIGGGVFTNTFMTLFGR
ncbi:MAG: sulfite exporter TauE/SafE family protein, partial [Pseudomonadota bacterium]